MKHYLLTAVFLITSVTLFAQPIEWKKDGRVQIKGNVKDFDPQTDEQSVNLIFHDLFEKRMANASVDSEGNFSVSVPVYYPQDFYVSYNKNLVTLLCSPGDTLDITLDTKSNKKAVTPIINPGSRQQDNQNIIQFEKGKPDSNYIYRKANDAIKNLDPEEYIAYIEQREKEYRIYWDNFKKERDVSPLFSRWVEDELHYESLNDLVRYSWLRSLYYEGNKKVMPEGYFGFLSKYDQNDNWPIANSHVLFLHELYQHLQRLSPADRAALNAIYNTEGVTAGTKKVTELIKAHTSGFTQKVMLSKLYLNILESQDIKTFEALYDADNVPNTVCENIVNNVYEHTKVFLSNTDTGMANLLSIKDESVKDLIDTMTTKYAGKVIYMDFWGPWCSPCLKEMPFSKEIQEQYKDKDVVFLYLAYDCTEDSWKASIANMKLTGEHVLLNNNQFKVLAAELGITGAPHYSMIDRKGNIALKRAERPSGKDQLQKQLDTLLNK